MTSYFQLTIELAHESMLPINHNPGSIDMDTWLILGKIWKFYNYSKPMKAEMLKLRHIFSFHFVITFQVYNFSFLLSQFEHSMAINTYILWFKILLILFRVVRLFLCQNFPISIQNQNNVRTLKIHSFIIIVLALWMIKVKLGLFRGSSSIASKNEHSILWTRLVNL